MTLKRRDFMIGGGMAAAGLALAPRIGLAWQDKTVSAPSAQAPGFYRTMVGKTKVTCLLDGGMTLGDELLLKSAAEDLSQAKEEHFIPAGKSFPAYVNAFLVDTGKKVTLIDTGAKGFAPTLGKLMTNMASAGYGAADIDDIIITHAHPDHTNGLLDNSGALAFPSTRLRIHQDELAFWFSDEKMASLPDKKQMFDLARKNLGPYKAKGQIETFKGNADLGGGLSALHLPGHTPGHSGVRIHDGKDQLLIWGDIVHVPAVQFSHPGVSIAFDLDPDQARVTRQKMFDEAATDRLRFAGMHLVFPAVGHLTRRDNGFDFVPQAWEVDPIRRMT